MPEIMGKPGHLCLVAVADEKGCGSTEQGHRDDDRQMRDVAHGLRDVGQPAHRAPHRLGNDAKRRAIGCLPEPDDQRQVVGGIEQDAVCRPQTDEHRSTHCRSDQDADIAGGRIEPHGAGQFRQGHDVVQQQLTGGLPQHAGTPVQGKQYHRMPDLERIGEEEPPPAKRDRHEQEHRHLDDPARIAPVGKRPHRYRKEQEGQPVRDHRKTTQGW